MATINRSALLEYSAQQMFDLVNDIEKYPEFMPGCRSVKIISASEDQMVGELCLYKAGISQRFTTKNRLTPPTEIGMSLVQGNFSNFHARWQFHALTESACNVSLIMEFEFTSARVDFADQKLFSGPANPLVHALVKPASREY